MITQSVFHAKEVSFSTLRPTNVNHALPTPLLILKISSDASNAQHPCLTITSLHKVVSFALKIQFLIKIISQTASVAPLRLHCTIRRKISV
jgi:hypothetical protein